MCLKQNSRGGNTLHIFGALLLFGLLFSSAVAESQTEAKRPTVVSLGGEDLEVGRFHLLAIAIDHYQDSDLNLSTAVAGARELESTLIRHYSFQKTHSQLLLDQDATGDGILTALRRLAVEAEASDSVLIYYAGHGNLDNLTSSGSWIPWDATFDKPSRWIGNERIKRLLKAMKARHVLLISDSCFAGDFFRNQRQVVPQISDFHVLNAFSKISRRAMTAGGLEPVADGGQDGQSVYTWWLLRALREAHNPYVLPEQIHDRIKKAVKTNSLQNPLYGLLHGAGGEPDATFVFFRRGTVSLEAAVQETVQRIKELEMLDKEGAEELRKQQKEIAAKQAQLAMVEKRLSALQDKVGSGIEQSDLDAILVMLRKREQKSIELEELRKKAEAELGAKEAALTEELRTRFEIDYQKFKNIVASPFASEGIKANAWRILRRNFGISDQIPMDTYLKFSGGKVVPIVVNALAGIRVEAVTAKLKQLLRLPESKVGVVVKEVKVGSAAEVAGLQQDDVILEINRELITSPKDYHNIALKIGKESLIVLMLSRGGNNLFVAVKPNF